MIKNKRIFLNGAIIGFLMGFIPRIILHLSLYLDQRIFYFREVIKSIYFGILFLILSLFPTYFYYKNDRRVFKYLVTITIILFVLFLVYTFFVYYTYHQSNAFGSLADTG